jgi:hypothetical protein
MESLSTKIYKNEFVQTFKGDDSGNLKPRQTPVQQSRSDAGKKPNAAGLVRRSG